MSSGLSHTEENYIKTIYHLSSVSEKSEVTTNAISEVLHTKAATVSDMMQKLAQKKILNYEKYYGVSLTPFGKKTALDIIRKHRLWEVFLVEILQYRWDEVHEIAEQMEHIRSETLIDRLDAFLGYPKVDPHGDPIPDQNGMFSIGPTTLLASCQKHDKVVLTGVVSDDSRLLQYLDKLDLHLGSKLSILDKNEYDESMELSIEEKKDIQLSSKICNQLVVKKLNL